MPNEAKPVKKNPKQGGSDVCVGGGRALQFYIKWSGKSSLLK